MSERERGFSPPAMDDVLQRQRVHVISEADHGTMRTANMGHGYHSLIFMFARKDMMTLSYTLPEPLRLMGIGTSRGAVPTLRDIRCNGRSICSRPNVETALIDSVIRLPTARTKRGKDWEFDVEILRDGLLVVTMG